jgi:hypothetical protein
MASDLIHDIGRGPEIRGTRITIYDLLPYFLDPNATEEYIGKVYDLTGEQVAAARASVFANADTVLARHLAIEEKLSEENPPEVVERARAMQRNLVNFKDWLAKREAEEREEFAKLDEATSPDRYPTFREWLSQKESLSAKDS